MATRKKALYRKLIAPFKGCSEAVRVRADKLANEADFMARTLEVLRQDIEERGPVIDGTNGNGFTVRQENPSQKSYNAMIKNFNSTISALAKLAETATGSAQPKDKLMEFLEGNK